MKFFLSILSSLTLAACGGGGGNSSATSATTVLSFPLRAGVNARIASGAASTLTAVGTAATQATDGLCTGTATQTSGAAAGGATFEGVAALSAVTVTTISFTNCAPASTTGTATDYYDSNYLPLGSNTVGGSYGVFLTPPVIPNSVTVGATGIIGTRTLYTDITKAVGDGRTDLSFVIESDTASTAIVNMISKRYNAASQLLLTEQDRYRITSTGALTSISADIQYATTSTTHLVFR